MTNHDLKYHFHPEKGWINDPNGLSYFKGEYHLFFQHAPDHEYPWEESMHWGHAVTSDFLEFTELPVALFPDREYDAGGVWSGSACVKDGILYLFYASTDRDGRQTISLATSGDGRHFEKHPSNPLIYDIPEDGSSDFRDPAVLCGPSGNYLVIASADRKKNTGNLLLYKSPDLISWEYVGVVREYPDSKYCECPSLVPAGDGYILSVSVVKNDGSHFFEVIYGDFDGTRFAPVCVSHFQKGPDEYAGQIFHDENGRNILISWIPGWKYIPKEKCIGCLSIPLEVGYIPEENRIFALPVREVSSIVSDFKIADGYILERYAPDGSEVYIELTEKPEGSE